MNGGAASVPKTKYDIDTLDASDFPWDRGGRYMEVTSTSETNYGIDT